MVRTVLGDVRPAELGRVDAHEHVFLRSPELPGAEFLDPARMTDELTLVRASGIDTVVDLTTIGIGRQPSALARVSAAAKVRVVAATGYHRDAHYRPDHWVWSATVDRLRSAMVRDITEGMDDRDWSGPDHAPTTVRAGIIKLGASYHRVSARESVRFEAGASAALATGVALAVHCEIGTAADEILDLLREHGVPSERVMLAHMDRNPDAGLHRDILATGARVVYDTVGRIKYRPDSQLIELIAQMIDAGFGDRIMLGTDVGRRDMLASYGGGPGMDVLGRAFVPRLSPVIGDPAVEQILVQTPAQFLTMKGTS